AVLLLTAGGVYFFLTRNRAVPAGIESVAVLPFANTSNDPNIDYLSDGVTDNLINNLSQLPNLKVIGHTSAFRYKGIQTDAQKIGKELGVAAVLTGRIVEHDSDLSIYVDLEDARDKTQIWGEQYNLKRTDLLVIQNEISHRITEKLR